MDGSLITWLLPLVLGGLAVIGSIAESRRRARALRRVAAGSTVIEDHALVTIRGLAGDLGDARVAPLSGRRCLAYCARAHVYDPHARRAKRTPVTVYARSELARFALHSPAGVIAVEGTHVELALKPGSVVRDDPRQQEFVASFGLTYEPDMTSFDEVILVPGEHVTVHGVVRIEVVGTTAVETGFREAPHAARIVGDEHRGVLITDV